MSQPGYNVDIEELRRAARWSEHQSDPAPDWNRLLLAAADDILVLRMQNDRVVTENDRLLRERDGYYDDDSLLEPLSVRDYLTMFGSEREGPPSS